MIREKEYLVDALKQAGIKSKVYTSLKMLNTANELHLGAVLKVEEKFNRSGSKKTYEDQEGHKKVRRKIFDRITTLNVVIADTDEDKIESILSLFLNKIGKGIAIDGNWSDIEIGDADWVDEGDSILKAKIAVQFHVTFYGGIYVDTDLVHASLGRIDAE